MIPVCWDMTLCTDDFEYITASIFTADKGILQPSVLATNITSLFIEFLGSVNGVLRYPSFRGVAWRQRTFRASKTGPLRSAETSDTNHTGAALQKKGHRS